VKIEWDDAAIQRLGKEAVRRYAERARPAIERTECPDHHQRAILVAFGDTPTIQACCQKGAELAAKAAGLDNVHWKPI
jgi:hypothetical protein